MSSVSLGQVQRTIAIVIDGGDAVGSTPDRVELVNLSLVEGTPFVHHKVANFEADVTPQVYLVHEKDKQG